VNQQTYDLNADQRSIITDEALTCFKEFAANVKRKKNIPINEEIRKAKRKTPKQMPTVVKTLKKMPTVVPETLPSKIRSYPQVPQT
jgi:hypothetical protein